MIFIVNCLRSEIQSERLLSLPVKDHVFVKFVTNVILLIIIIVVLGLIIINPSPGGGDHSR